jgi:hypothetical protein
MNDYIIDVHPIPNGKMGCVIPLTYNRARICVGPDHVNIDEGW